MYTKNSVKSYAQGRERKSSYKRNILPFGSVGASVALHAVTEGVKEVWRRGKKSKLGKALSNPSMTLSVSNTQYEVGDIVTGNDGRIIEILAKSYKHPNKYKYTYKVIKSNPGSKSVSPEVEDLSKDWHGREVRGSTEVEEIEEYEEELVDLGFLEELGIIGGDSGLFTITFKKDRPTLACDGNGQSLEIIGGDQELDLKSEGIEQKGKLLVPIGYVYSIVYETDKHHLEGSNGYPEPYEHYFAEEFYKKVLDPDKFENMDDWFDELMEMGRVDEAKESGRLPVAVYNRTDGKILLAGGGYEVTELGIKD